MAKKIGSLRDLFENNNHDQVVDLIEEGLRTGEFAPEDFSIRELWEATVGPVNETMSLYGASEETIREAITSSTFPKASAALIQQAIIAAYDAVPTTGDQLVTVVPSRLRKETILGFNAQDTLEEVGEGEEYPRTGLTEKFFTGMNVKYGQMVEITEESIIFDQTGQILARATRVGANAAEHREKLIIDAVTDVDPTNQPVYAPQGVAEALYSAGNSNLETTNPFGESGLNTSKNNLMRKTDEEGDPIFVNPTGLILLHPPELETQVWQMLRSPMTPEDANTAQNFFRGRYNPISTPYITATTDWWLGDFKRQFWYTEVLPIQVTRARPSEGEMFDRDIRNKVKVRYMADVVAIDERFVVKNTA